MEILQERVTQMALYTIVASKRKTHICCLAAHFIVVYSAMCSNDTVREQVMSYEMS